MAKKYYLYMLFSVQSQIFTKGSDIAAGEVGVVSCLASLLILQDFVMIYIMQHDSEFREEPQWLLSWFWYSCFIFCSFSVSLFWIIFNVRSSYFTYFFSY